MFGIGLPELIIIAVIGIVVVLPFWKILTKAGFSGWWSLIMLIPIIGILTLFYLAFAEWPIQRELNKLKNNLK
jgi:uncharacterized membrane protein YhaH (DUF805 family)